MSKRRHRNRPEEQSSQNRNMSNQQQNNYPFGINPNQLLSMFGNIDMSQINNMLQSMNTEGFDFNNLNLGSLQNLMGGRTPQAQQQTQTQPKPTNTQTHRNEKAERNSNRNGFVVEDDNIQMLKALRSFVNEERVEFIDKVIKIYNEGGFDD